MTTNPKYARLFEKVQLNDGITLQNRIAIAPMTHSSSNPDLSVSDAELSYYERRTGKLGLAITAVAHVTPGGIGFKNQFAAFGAENLDGLSKLAASLKKGGAKAVLQIFHAGIQGPRAIVPNEDVVGASAIELQDGSQARELSAGEIDSIVSDFGRATELAIEAGFDGVEIHGANGYLIQQFFSGWSNRREDKWGGSVEKRLAFPLAVVDEVQRAAAAKTKEPFIVGYRFSPEEPHEEGITMDHTVTLLDALAGKNLSYLHVSLMEYASKPRRGGDLNRTRLEQIVEAAKGTPVVGVGSVHTPDQAIEALELGAAIVALGRELIVEPDWVEKVEAGQEADIAVTLTKDDQQRLVVPDQLWGMIIGMPGWFPVVETEAAAE
ncbi:NADH-dependent flavin oxidoreductase [Saccharibacillus sp. CPCC 101409]|uniref:NADH-dependent flavin oxidoreductase n=1 Tax=Saccharibacillus sp. CPCC 101409 TaxID=3058041 RepID=UPI00267208A9|nr:NADH-dependent flavin oxidoreductase [Saccharibacillus sp. CPCC 101409]MDO3411341.1 NADH-dependent flavin oxidoreductase [Saccharibacillus sp. CPCC 101409]